MKVVTVDRLLVHQFDPFRPVPGGIDTCIRGLVKFAPPDFRFGIVGVDASGSFERLGRWHEVLIEDRTVQFFPVARLNPADQRRVVPHTVRIACGLARYRPVVEAEIVQTHRVDLGAFCLPFLRRRPYVQFLHIDGSDSLREGSDSHWKHLPVGYRLLERAVLPRAIDVVVFNDAGAERLKADNPETRSSPTWFDPQRFRPPGPDGIRARTSILWVGRVEPPKDPFLLLDVMERLPDHFQLTVVGDGTLAPEMQRRARELGVDARINFKGAVPKDEVADTMRTHGMLLMTSHYEGFPRAVVESLACGLPVITTPGGEPNGLVEDGINGLRASTRNAQELADLIVRSSEMTFPGCARSVAHLSADRVVADVLRTSRASA